MFHILYNGSMSKSTILLISPYWREEHRWMVSSYKLAELWQRLGYRVVVACMGSSNRVEQVSDTLTVHFRKDIFLPDPWNYGIAFGFAGYVRRLVKQEQPDLIITNKLLFWTTLALIPLRLSGKRVILLTDALVGMTWWPRGKIPQICAAIYAWTLGWLLLKLASRIVFFHPQPASLLRTLGISKKVDVIPTGIDPTPYREIRNPPDFVRTGRTTPGKKSEIRNEIVITYIGRLESVKGVDDFLAAASAVKAERTNVTVQVVGWYKEEHPLVAQYHDRVTFTGLRKDIPAVLAGTDIFVLPSYSEGLSNALMEAMASSCACVASDVGGNAFLLQNGVSGFLFPAGDREALQAHLRRLIDDPAKRMAMAQAASKRIDDVFSWEKVSKSYAEFFSELIIDN